MFTIGEFSKITGMGVKTLRFYHEKGLLIPTHIDEASGYRYYNQGAIERGRIISQLRAMEFSISQVKEILENCEDQVEILDYLEEHKKTIEKKLSQYKNIAHSLNTIITTEREAIMAIEQSQFEVEEKQLEPVLIAGVRMKGKYSDCGKGFAKIGKKLGRYINGKAMNLYYDGEYRENDADFEACMPVKKKVEAEGISIREIPGGKCVALLHKGPYEEFTRSYEKIMQYIKEKEYEIILPTREVYLKGPGMIFKGNPKNYLSEIQMLIKG